MVRLGLDLDGTLADSWSSVLALLESKYGIRAVKEEIKNHEIIENEPFRKLTRQQAYDAFVEVWDNYETIKLVDPNIPRLVKSLRNEYDEVYLTTATVTNIGNMTKWLRYTGIELDGIIKFSRPEDKIMAGMDVIADDYHVAVEAAANDGKSAVLLSQPWNSKFRATNGNSKIRIADNWDSLYRHLLEEHMEISMEKEKLKELARKHTTAPIKLYTRG